MLSKEIKKNTVVLCWVIFLLLIFVHGFEAIFLKTDETFFGENFINKLFGIAVVFILLRYLNWRWSDIGFKRIGFVKNAGLGILLAICSFIISYGVEIALLKTQGYDAGFGIFTTSFSLTGETVVHSGLGFILMCIFFNIINVVMEEGAFRGIIYQIVAIDHSLKYALFFQAFLFGVWHIVTPIHNLIDGDINLESFITLSISYIILAGMMGIKWGLLYRMTGSLYAGMADHFFNNCIATNLLHVITVNGVDEMMIVRVVIAQLISFVVVFLVWKKREKSGVSFEK